MTPVRRGHNLVVVLLALLLLADSMWRLSVDSCRTLPYDAAADRLQVLMACHPAPHYARQLYADMSWEHVQQARNLATVELVWGLTREVWLQTGRDVDRARAAWMAVMLQHTPSRLPE